MTEPEISHIAMMCHEVNRVYCQSIGDDSQQSWDKAAGWQRDSAIRGVRFALDNPSAPASAQHDAWLSDKVADGWKWGPVKDADAKQHPCMVDYAALPVEQRIKDHLFKGVVRAFATAMEGE